MCMHTHTHPGCTACCPAVLIPLKIISVTDHNDWVLQTREHKPADNINTAIINAHIHTHDHLPGSIHWQEGGVTERSFSLGELS